MRLEVFNNITAYLFLTIIQVFDRQSPEDQNEEEKPIEST